MAKNTQPQYANPYGNGFMLPVEEHTAFSYGASELVNYDKAAAYRDSLQEYIGLGVSNSIYMFQIAPGGLYQFGNGTVSAPSISFYADQDTGLYKPAASQLGVSIDGVQEALFTSSGLTIPDLTSGSVIFAGTGGLLSQNNASFFWDNTNLALTVDTVRISDRGTDNLFIGASAGNFTFTGNGGNVGIGKQALTALTTGYQNVAIGYQAFKSNQTGFGVVAIGFQCLQADTAVISNNTAVGWQAMYSTTSGPDNCAFGYAALYTNTTGANNNAFGLQALYTLLSGSSNNAFGDSALFTNSTGSNNTALGHAAGYLNTGSNNVFIGYSAGYNETGSNKLYIAHTSTTTPLIYGDFGNTYVDFNGNVGINLASNATPARKLEVLGADGAMQLRLTYTAATNYVEFGSDASGNYQVSPTNRQTNLNDGTATVTLNIGDTSVVSTSGGSFRIAAGAQTNNNIIIDPRSTGAVYLGFVSGSGGVNIGDGAAGVVTTIGVTGAVFNEPGGDADFRVEGDSAAYMIFMDATSTTENIALLTTAAPNWQSGDKILFIGNADAAPTGDPSSGGFLYSESGALKWRGSSGTITTIAPA